MIGRSTRQARNASLAMVLIAAAALAGCNTDGAGSMAQAPEPMTRQRAAAICWDKTEKDAGKMTLDKRADIVTKCIDDRMKSAPRT